MKRTLACTLAVLMLIGLAACGGTPATIPATTPATTPATVPETAAPTLDPNDPISKANLPEMDFEGRTFTIIDGDNILSGNIQGSNLEAEKANMWLYLADRYSCEFDLIPSDYTIFETAGPVLMTGDFWADIVETKAWVSGYFVQAGYCKDMSKLDYLDFTKDYWIQSTVKEGNFKGRQLLVSGSYGMAQNIAWGLFFNKTLAEELKVPDLYQLVRDGQWTIDKFAEYARKATFDSNGDNIMDENDTYGWGGPRGDVDYAFTTGLNIKPYKTDENGNIVVAMGDYAEQVNALKDVLNSTTIGLLDWAQYYTVFFRENRLLFAPYYPSGTTIFWSEMEDFGFIPMPKWNADQEGYYAYNDHHLPTTFIPLNVVDANESAFIMEAMACYAQAVIEPTWLSDYESTYLRDEDSYEMLVTYFMPGLTANPVVTYWSMAAPDAMLALTIAYNTIILGENFSTVYESYSEIAQIAVDELFEQNTAG